MALANSNIDTSMAANAIGVASHDVFTLCTHANVNKGSKFKPGFIQVSLPYASYMAPDGMSTHPLRGHIHDACLDDFALYNHAAVVPGIQGQPATMHMQVRNVGNGNMGYAAPITVSVDLGELDWWNKESQTHGRIYYRTGGASVWNRMRVRATLGSAGADDAVCASDWKPCSETVRTGTFTITPVIQPDFGSQNYWIVLEIGDSARNSHVQLADRDAFGLIDLWVERVFDPGMWPTPHYSLASASFNGKYVYDVDNRVLGKLSEVQDIRFKGDYSFTQGMYGEWRTNNFQVFLKAVFIPEEGVAYPLSEFQIMSTGYTLTYDLWQFMDIPNASGKAEQIVLADPGEIFASSAYYGKGSLFFGNYTPGKGSLPDGGSNVNGFFLSAAGSYVPNIKTFVSSENYGQGKGNIHGISLVSGPLTPGTVSVFGFPSYAQDNPVTDCDLSQVRPDATGWMDIQVSFQNNFTSAQQSELAANNQTYEIKVRDANSGWKPFVTVKNYASNGNGYIWFQNDNQIVFHCNVPAGVSFDGNGFMMMITYKGLAG